MVSGDAWVLLDADPEHGLGPALAWALRRGAGRVNVLAERATSQLARRALRFSMPIDVWHVDGRALIPAVAFAPDAPPPARPEHLALGGLITEAGADVAVEHGIVTGEVRGLEVCRVVDRPDDGDVVVEVGIGRHDREAFAMLHGHVPTVDALADVVRQVGAHRVVGAPPHPLNLLARERFLRWRLVAEPSLAGVDRVTPVEPITPRRTVAESVPCAAIADEGSQTPFDLVVTAGVDLDAVAYAADVQRDDRPTRLVLPANDLLAITRDLAGLLTVPIELLTVD